MRLWIANIGGAAGYKNVLNKLNSTKTQHLSDKLITQECGSGENSQGLEPYFACYI